jgi:hypothetical protein
MDLSTAAYVQMVTPGVSLFPRSIRSGALFVFRGGLDEILVTSPNLVDITEEARGDWFFLTLEFNTAPREVMDKLRVIDFWGPAFVIVRLEEEKRDPVIICPAWLWEQGYHIADVVRMDEKRVTMAVRKGEKK